MANRIVSVHAGIYGMGIYAIMLPSSWFSVAHCERPLIRLMRQITDWDQCAGTFIISQYSEAWLTFNFALR